jgi:C_GCAxxG_C_C family probable redox protein
MSRHARERATRRHFATRHGHCYGSNGDHPLNLHGNFPGCRLSGVHGYRHAVMTERGFASVYGDKAASYFRRGYNCAQSTAVAFAEDFKLDETFLLKLTAGFGAGVGGLRETCGAVSAMALLAGLRTGSYAPDDIDTKTSLYDLVKRMHAEFVGRHGTACCRELLERAGVSANPNPSLRDPAYYAARPCAKLVASAAEIIAHHLGLAAP